MNINKFVAEKIKYFRVQKGFTQEDLAEKLGTTYQSISRYESGDRRTNNEILYKLAGIFNVSISDFFPADTDASSNITLGEFIHTPVLGFIKAGVPMDAQEDILGYIDIPERMYSDGKDYFGLRISGNSMSPKYQDGEIVIFEKLNDINECNGEDCAVMVNHSETTFKQIKFDEQGITLIPYNLNDFELTHFTMKEAEELPISIIGVAVGACRSIRRKNAKGDDFSLFI